MELKTANQLEAYIRSHGEKLEKFSSWEKLAVTKNNSFLLTASPSGYAHWFSIVKGKSIWWVSSDSSDGGIWSTEGVEVTGYKIAYSEEISAQIKKLHSIDRQNKNRSNPYAQMK
jgi:hypothetical protein